MTDDLAVLDAILGVATDLHKAGEVFAIEEREEALGIRFGRRNGFSLLLLGFFGCEGGQQGGETEGEEE